MGYGALMITISYHSYMDRRSYEVGPLHILSASSHPKFLDEGHKYIRPKAIHDAEIVDEYSKHYMYFACIKFINSVHSHSFHPLAPCLTPSTDQNRVATVALPHVR